jgi:hypothetical protein
VSAELWRQFRAEHPDVPAKQIENLWRQYVAQRGSDAVEAPKRRGRPPGSKNRVAEPVEQ